MEQNLYSELRKLRMEVDVLTKRYNREEIGMSKGLHYMKLNNGVMIAYGIKEWNDLDFMEKDGMYQATVGRTGIPVGFKEVYFKNISILGSDDSGLRNHGFVGNVAKTSNQGTLLDNEYFLDHAIWSTKPVAQGANVRLGYFVIGKYIL